MWWLAAQWMSRWREPPTSQDWAADHSAGTAAWCQRYKRRGRQDHLWCCQCAWTVLAAYRQHTDDIWCCGVRWRQPLDCSTQQTTVGLVTILAEHWHSAEQCLTGAGQSCHITNGRRGQSSAISVTPNWDCRHSISSKWSTVSNAADRSGPINTVICLLSADV